MNTYIRAVSVELKAKEQQDLEQRLEELEELLEARKGSDVGMRRRVSAMERYVEEKVEERLEEELEACFDRLERALSREEARRVLGILAGEEEE